MQNSENTKEDKRILPPPKWFIFGSILFLPLPIWFYFHLEFLWVYTSFAFFLFSGSHFLNSLFSPTKYHWFLTIYPFLFLSIVFGWKKIPGLKKLDELGSLLFLSKEGFVTSILCGFMFIILLFIIAFSSFSQRYKI